MFDIYPKDTKVIDAAKILREQDYMRVTSDVIIHFLCYCSTRCSLMTRHSCKVVKITKKKKRDRELGVLVYS